MQQSRCERIGLLSGLGIFGVRLNSLIQFGLRIGLNDFRGKECGIGIRHALASLACLGRCASQLPLTALDGVHSAAAIGFRVGLGLIRYPLLEVR